MTLVALPELITVLPWTEADPAEAGFDPRSAYVERYYLGILGPSGTWIMRRFAERFDHDHDGFLCDPADLAVEIGLGRGIGRNAPFTRTIDRLNMFDLVRRAGDQLHVRTRLPHLNRRQVSKLPEALARAHQADTADRGAPTEADQVRARVLAAQLAELGDEIGRVEVHLQIAGVSPAAAHDAACWAASRMAHPSHVAAKDSLVSFEQVAEDAA